MSIMKVRYVNGGAAVTAPRSVWHLTKPAAMAARVVIWTGNTSYAEQSSEMIRTAGPTKGTAGSSRGESRLVTTVLVLVLVLRLRKCVVGEGVMRCGVTLASPAPLARDIHECDYLI